MKSFVCSWCVFMLFCSWSWSQDSKVSLTGGRRVGTPIQEIAIYKSFKQVGNRDKTDLYFKIQRVGKNPSPSSEVEMLKQQKTQQKLQSSFSHEDVEVSLRKTQANEPIKNREFSGNSFDGSYPNDNNIAISQNGYIVSVINSKINFYNTNGQLIDSQSLSDFANNPNLTSMHYDPVCVYDPSANRFIVAHLHGTVASESKVIVAFSKSENPANGFWVYTLNGNVGNRGRWFDYPKIAISNNDVFITGNLFDNSDVFKEPTILQIPKSPGYNGSTLSYTSWLDITDGDGNTPFTLLPLSGGYGNYGPGIYLVSTKSSSGSKVQLYDVTNDYGNNPSIQAYAISTTSYSVGGKVLQKNTNNQLDNGDCRSLSGFYANGICHFVFCSDRNQGWNGINYNRLTVSSKTNVSDMFGLDGYDYCYPAVAAMGYNASDKSVCIAFLRSSQNSFPECRAVFVDDNGTWSSSISVKTGEDYIDLASSTDERWGDYTGIAKRFGAANPTVWVAGNYGKSTLFSSNINGTWIAELQSSNAAGIDPDHDKSHFFTLYPNPTKEKYFTLKFSLERSEKIEISLFDAQGRILKCLFKGYVRPGEHRLSFNEYALTPGTYFISVQTENHQQIAYEKLLIVD